MTKILFVCHGNICRSPMAHFIFQHMVNTAGRSHEFYIDSAATSTEELGCGIYPPARRKLGEEGIPLVPHTAVQITRGDYDKYDMIFGMDSANIRNIHRICGGDPQGKVKRLLELTQRPGDVADPWYTGNFDAAYRNIREGCEALMKLFTP